MEKVSIEVVNKILEEKGIAPLPISIPIPVSKIQSRINNSPLDKLLKEYKKSA